MTEQAKTEMSCGGPSYPLRKWWQSSRLFNQDVGLPPFLEPGDPWWMNVDRLQRSLAACAWPGYIPAPLFVPYISGSMHQPGQEISKEQYKWRVNLDVAHFSPSEICLSITDGFLEVAGKHEERPDEHGFIARCFTRKYRLPAEIDATKITSSLSVDGILTVEAPVPETSVPAAVVIPIKVEIEATEEQEVEEEKEETAETEAEVISAPEAPEFLPAEDHVEESPLEVHSDEAHPGSATAGLEQHEEKGEQEEEEEEEETHEQPAGESLPSASADDATESLQESSEQHESPESQESQESPETDTSKPLEQDQPAVDVEVQVMAGSGEAAEEIAQPEEPEQGQSPLSEVPSQELQAPDIKQVHIQ